MRTIIIGLLMFFSVALSANTPYDKYYQMVKVEMVRVRQEIKQCKTVLKRDPNNIDVHKALVRAQTHEKLLNDKKKTVDKTYKLYKQLVKQNEVLDKQKTKLLHIKEQSEEADRNLMKIFSEN